MLFLDDDQRRHKAVCAPGTLIVHVYTATQAIEALRSYAPFDVVSLDRDLFYETIDETGEDVVKYLVERHPSELRPKRVVVHSSNQEASHRMFLTLRNAGFAVTVEPWKDS